MEWTLQTDWNLERLWQTLVYTCIAQPQVALVTYLLSPLLVFKMPGAVETNASDVMSASSPAELVSAINYLLHSIRGVGDLTVEEHGGIVHILQAFIQSLNTASKEAEANALAVVLDRATDSPSYGGLGITTTLSPGTVAEYEDVLFLVSAHLTALNYALDDALQPRTTIPTAHPETHPMTLAQKIFAHHRALTAPSGRLPLTGLSTGAVVRVGLDWVLASELSWASMARTHQELGHPGIWRNDRFWLAGDHVVHPSTRTEARTKALVAVAEKAKTQFRMTEYQGMNYTIMHTEFVRERAEPGMLCIGSDSHTCSAGAVGCLSIGLGAADVMMGLALGQTWFKIPESIRIQFVGQPGLGIAGKDVILHILRALKRNTVASERIVEFGGEGARYLSVDARFAICNMCTEFGAVTGVFVPDDITKTYVEKRRRKAYRSNSVYFRPDKGAEYAGEYTIDLSRVEHTIAVYPEPDHVVPVSEKAGMKVDGVFIGACTTTEEEIVLGALVLRAGLKQGLPLAPGKRHYVPGSLPIVDKLSKLGLLDVYEEAGFTRGPPGCSFCLGLSVERAQMGETWLSSQNRNFKNRMGPGKISWTSSFSLYEGEKKNRFNVSLGAFGNLSSAVVCAASAFSLTVTDPAPFLVDVDFDWYEKVYLQRSTSPSNPVTYVEPNLSLTTPLEQQQQLSTSAHQVAPEGALDTIQSTIITLGDFIDTDALAPSAALATCVTDEDYGRHCLEHTHPEFRDKVKSYPGSTAVVVAGRGFGVGSSRENAVSALKGCGIQCVISKSFAFIFGRNVPSLGLLGFNITDETFYEAAKDGRRIKIDVTARKVWVDVDGEWKAWDFVLSEMEYRLTVNKGVAESFKKYGKRVWDEFTKGSGDAERHEAGVEAKVLTTMPEPKQATQDLDW